MNSATASPVDAQVMAFDFGTRKIGLAIGHSRIGAASPLGLVKARDGIPDWQALDRLIAEWRPDHFVLGMPFNMDGSDSQLCPLVRKFGRRLTARYRIAVSEMDERLTTFEARGDADTAEPVDDRSACLILESWFREHCAT